MGGQGEGDVSVSRAENTVSGLKTESEDLFESYVSHTHYIPKDNSKVLLLPN